jgi:hypothetical protein
MYYRLIIIGCWRSISLSLSPQTHCELLLPEKPRKTQNLLRNCWGITKIDPLLRTKEEKETKNIPKDLFLFQVFTDGPLAIA